MTNEIALDSTDQTGTAGAVNGNDADSTGTAQDRAQDDDPRVRGLMKLAGKRQNVIDAQQAEIDSLRAEVTRLATEEFPPMSQHAGLPELDEPTEDTQDDGDDAGDQPMVASIHPQRPRDLTGFLQPQPLHPVIRPGAYGLDRAGGAGNREIDALRASAGELNRRWADEQRELNPG